MRLTVRDIDDLAVTPADLSDLAFEGSPATVLLSIGEAGAGRTVSVEPVSADPRYDLSGELEPPCDATATWAAGYATLHVVSYHYCTLDDVLEFGDEKRQSPHNLGRTQEEAFWARAVAERVCDDLCGRTFRATLKVDVAVDGPVGRHQLEWPATRVLTPGWELVGDGMVRAPRYWDEWAGAGFDDAAVAYVSGSDRGVPADVRRAVSKLAASYLTISKVPDRAVYESTEAGMTRYTLASSDSTGIPDVDAVFQRHARSRWAVL